MVDKAKVEQAIRLFSKGSVKILTVKDLKIHQTVSHVCAPKSTVVWTKKLTSIF